MPHPMTAVEATAFLDENHGLQLDEELPMSGPMRVRVIVMYPLDEAAVTGGVPEVAEDLARDPNYVAYVREREMLEADHPGEHVGYCRGQRVALAPSNSEVFSRLDTQFPDEPCFVKRISREPRRITFPRPRKIRRRATGKQSP